MKISRALAGLAVVTLVQMLLGRHLPAVAQRCDLFTIFTVYVALTRPARPAILLGTGAGLVQDALIGAVLGLNGFKKTLLAYLVGSLGSLFMVQQGLARFGLLFAAAFYDALASLGLSLAMGQHDVFPPLTDLLVRGAVNGIVGLMAFWVAARIP